MPWFQARFVALAGFEPLQPLFREELDLVEREDFDADAWQELWERIWAEGVGVALLLPDGTEVKRDFAVHVYEDGTVRFRY